MTIVMDVRNISKSLLPGCERIDILKGISLDRFVFNNANFGVGWPIALSLIVGMT